MGTKKELETKRELGRFYYMQGEIQKIIAQKVGVSEVTVSRWVKSEGWEARRAATKITRTQIVNRTLLRLNKMLESSENDENFASIADQLAKAAAAIEKLDKKANIVDAIEVFMAFNKWLIFRQTFDKEVTTELIKAINKYQDLYITEHVNKSLVN
jgi:uncharacterized protein YjcR